jgi:RTX calcium-binding nonapeptide repeat (4 copies)
MSKKSKLKGGPEDDVLIGTEYDDQLFGRRGNDVISGLAGNDRLKGGNGDDGLFGGPGDDYMFGGDGDDNMRDSEGSNVFFGGDGNDVIWNASATGIPLPRVVIHAGAGNDVITADYVDRILVSAGSGDDSVTVRPTVNAIVFGGEGNDVIEMAPMSKSATIDAGPGDDLIISSVSSGSHQTVTTGPGRDTVFVGNAVANGLVITDFTPGVNGEILDLSGSRPALGPLFGWLLGEFPPRPDPFDSGYLRLSQVGPDALLQLDSNGPQNGENFVTIVTLRNVDSQSMTSENFRYPAPVGALPSSSQADTALDINAVIAASSGWSESDALAGTRIDSSSAVIASPNLMEYIDQMLCSANTAPV